MDSYEDSDTVAEHLDRTDSAQQAVIWREATTDYHGALVRLATMRAAGKQYLLFGYVELFPRDIPVPESFSAGKKPWRVPNSGGGVTLAVSAVQMSVVGALDWYEVTVNQMALFTTWSGYEGVNAWGWWRSSHLGRISVSEQRIHIDVVLAHWGVQRVIL